ncbi:FAD-dependent oxidoreductase [Streptomyces sp. NPDC046887]|uniref:FAD-dependent oxidoreductase n=1 Tax=Streptomyces sp. NPDC046887 TaxID=3155472 RepID=UPI0033CC2A06
MRRERTVDVLVVGAGPAGLASAARLASAGAGVVEVLERESAPGGALRYLRSPGPGLPLGGPGYARWLTTAALRAGAVLRTGVSATGWADLPGTGTGTGARPGAVETTGPGGLERITARAVVLATGARERPRSARLVPGTRPAGVLTTGELLRTVELFGQRVGERAVVVGGGPVARRAVLVLRRSGTEVAAVVAEEAVGGWRRSAGGLGGPVPLLRGARVTGLAGRGRLSGVAVTGPDGRTAVLGCDTVVFTGDWVPDQVLARYGGVVLDPGTGGPAVDAGFRTSAPGVFAVGNTLHAVEHAPSAAAEGRAVAGPVLDFLRGDRSWSVARVPVRVAGPLRWAVPNLLVPGAAAPDAVRLRALRPLPRPVRVEVRQDGRLLARHRLRSPLGPDRSGSLPGGWADRVDPAGGPVRIAVC